MTNYHDRILKMATNKSGVAETEYYTRVFTKMGEHGWVSWNWCAFFFGNVWIFYRRMYLFFLVVLGIGMIIPPFIMRFAVSIVDKADYLATVLLHVAPRILLGLFGNKLYYFHLKRQVQSGYDALDEKSVDSGFFLAVIIFGMGSSFMLLPGSNSDLVPWFSGIWVVSAVSLVLYPFMRYLYRRIKLRKLKASGHHLIP